jgi:DNA-binding MarR family transcriptional regulator
VSTSVRPASHRRPEADRAAALDEPWPSLIDCYHALRRRKTAVLAEHGLSVLEFQVLDLCGRAPARASEVAHEVGLTPAGATDLIDRLESRGLVARLADPADRRAVLVRVTPNGERVHRSARTTHRQIFVELHQRLTPAELRALSEGLAALRGALDDAVPP